MGEEKYRIVFRGELREGASPREVKDNLARLFKLSPARLDLFFSGKAIQVKSGLDREQARKFRDAFQQAGAECLVLRDGPLPPSPEAVPEAVPDAPEQPTRPSAASPREKGNALPETGAADKTDQAAAPPRIIIKDERTRREALAPYQVDVAGLKEMLGRELQGSNEAQELLGVCREELIPEKPSAYVPSGQTTASAKLLMIPAVPLAAVLGIVGWGLCLAVFINAILPLYFLAAGPFGRILTIAGLVVLLLLFFVGIVYCGSWIVARTVQMITRLGGNRSPKLASRAAFAAGVLQFTVFYTFYLTGGSLKHHGVDISPFFTYGIPLLGAATAFLAASLADERVREDKFCEIKGVFLKRHVSRPLDLAGLPAFFQALADGDYKALTSLPALQRPERSYFKYSLFYRSQPFKFGIGFLEASVHLEVDYRARKTDKNTVWESETWRFLSLAHESKEIIRIARALKLAQ
ncbi:MAG: hypothetical protein V1816_04945 [Pseudomonadota bacterium]